MYNIHGKNLGALSFIFVPVGVTEPHEIQKRKRTSSVKNVTMARLNARYGTAREIQKDGSSDDSDEDSDEEESVFKYEKDQPAGAIFRYVINKYLGHYHPESPGLYTLSVA